MRTTTLKTLAALLLLLLVGHPYATARTLRTVALSGEVVQGTDGARISRIDNFSSGFYSENTPVLNDAGQTAFFANLNGPEEWGPWRYNTGLLSEGGGTGLALVAREGGVAPGTDGDQFSMFGGYFVLNDAGQTAFAGALRLTSEASFRKGMGIWSESTDAGLAPVVRKGDTAPGSGSAQFSLFNRSSLGPGFRLTRFSFNDAGQTAFGGGLNGTGVDNSNYSGIWSERVGTGLALVARMGNVAPDTGGANFSYLLSLNTTVLNDAGQTAFVGRLTGTTVDTSNDQGIWSEGGGAGLALVTRTGNAAPGTSSGVIFSSLSPPALNAAGQTAFAGRLTGTGVDSQNNSGIWSEGGGNELALVALTGDVAPGTDGAQFSSVGSPLLNDAGQTAFVGDFTGTGVGSSNGSGIWSEGGGTGLDLVARSGDRAPGISSGVHFTSFGDLVLNDTGQMAFVGGLAGTGVSRSNRSGIWAEDRSGDLKFIVRRGDLLDVDDGPGTDFRTVVDFSFTGNTGNGDGRPSGFNNRGQLAFSAVFSDGSSGVFVSNLAAIPEPATWMLGLFALFYFSVQRR